MFCNQCGKKNNDGTKFCTQCGAALRTGQAHSGSAMKPHSSTAIPTAAGSNIIMPKGIKNLLTLVWVMVLLIIAAVNILKVQLGAINIPIKNELQQANKLSDICETDSYIYFVSDALYKMDKKSNAVVKVSSKRISPFVATNNCIYGFENNENCYKISDKSDDVKRISGIECSAVNDFFISGRYNYTISTDGTITKKLNSNKSNSCSVDIYSGDSSEHLIKAEMYEDYIYMILSDISSLRSGYSTYSNGRLIRVSVKTGKEEELTDNSILGFTFAGNQIVCNSVNDGFFIINLDGSNEQKYTEVDNSNITSFIFANGYVYYIDYATLYRFSISGGEAEELESLYNGLTEVNGGFASVLGNKLTLIDYDGNEIASVEPKK